MSIESEKMPKIKTSNLNKIKIQNKKFMVDKFKINKDKPEIKRNNDNVSNKNKLDYWFLYDIFMEDD